MHEMKLVWPSSEYLPSYVTALERGWSPDNLRAKRPLGRNSQELQRTRLLFSRVWSTSKRPARRSRFRMARPFRDFRAIDAGSGMTNSVAASDFVGNTGPRHCPP